MENMIKVKNHLDWVDLCSKISHFVNDRNSLIYSETDVRFIKVKLTKISCRCALFEVLFIQDSSLFRVWFRQVS
jgi:hypothetical protein